MKKFSSLLAGLLLFAGCATTKIDWQSRVGAYTFDQAVLDFGPPDKSAVLTDGTRVAEWLTHRSRNTGSYIGAVGGGGLVHVMSDTTPDYFLRLSFDPNGKLQAFKKYAK